MYTHSVAGEDALLHFSASLEKNRKGWLAVHIQLSRLRPENRGPDQLRVATETFDKLLQRFDSKLFVIVNGDIIFVINGATIADVDPIVMRLRYLFAEDPMFYGSDQADSTRFCTWYNLITEYRAFMSRVTQLAKLGTVDPRKEAEKLIEDQEQGPKPLDHNTFKDVVERLERADLASSLRRQSICLIGNDGVPKPVFSEVFISIGELNRTLMPSVNIASNRWLFQFLTNVLDQHMLGLVSKPTEGMFARAFSLNLNVASLLSPAFNSLDKRLSDQAKKTVMIELQPLDVYADMGAYVFAKESLQEKGYRICLDSVTHLTLPYVDRRSLGADLLKLFCSSDMLDDPSGTRIKEMQDIVQRAGEGRVILARCDDEQAIAFGQRLGITLFQGRHLDSLLGRQAV